MTLPAASLPPALPRRLLALLLAASLPLGACSGPPVQTTETPAAPQSESQPGPQPVYSPAQLAARNYDLQHAEAATRAGGEALARGDLAEARSRFESAIEAWPVLRPAWQGLATVAERQGDAEAERRARFFLARLDWIEKVHPLAAAQAFRNLSEGRTTEQEIDTPAFRAQAARLVEFLQSADLANVEAANRLQPGEDFVQRYGIYVAGLAGLALLVGRFNTVLLGDSGSD